MADTGIHISIRTGIPSNFYSVIPKIILLSVFLLVIIENSLLAIAIGLLSGIILHLSLSYYDCIVQIEKDILTLYYLRPLAFKEEFDLLKMDKVEIIKENKVRTLKESWVIADGIGQFSYDKLILQRQHFIHHVRFRTNNSDLPKLEAAINAILNQKKMK